MRAISTVYKRGFIMWRLSWVDSVPFSSPVADGYKSAVQGIDEHAVEKLIKMSSNHFDNPLTIQQCFIKRLGYHPRSEFNFDKMRPFKSQLTLSECWFEIYSLSSCSWISFSAGLDSSIFLLRHQWASKILRSESSLTFDDTLMSPHFLNFWFIAELYNVVKC